MKYTKWTPTRRITGGGGPLSPLGLGPLSAAVLTARGASTPEAAAAFLDTGEHLLADPFLMRDMDKATARIRRAVADGETIAVYGDYDVDGITSTTLLTAYLRTLGASVIPYIPCRLTEGYGLNKSAITALKDRGVTLLVTVDCGITNLDEVDYAASLGMDTVVTDHHECKDTLPRAAAVVNPRRPDCGYPFPSLAGVGVALKLVLALAPPEARSTLFHTYADLAAIGTVADVMETTGENRAIIAAGLAMLAHPRRPGLAALMQEAGVAGQTVTSTSIGFSIAPRLNAAGRMGCAMLAVDLLLTADPAKAASLAGELCALNRTRQATELEIYQECLTLPECGGVDSPYAIVLAGEHWHQGVVGIVASRLAEQFSRPAFMICLKDGMGKGSCRSFGGLNLFAALEACSDLLESFGGHALAAGFTIRQECVAPFRARMNEYIARQQEGEAPVSLLRLDGEIADPGLLSLANVADLNQLEPCGNGNPRPVFLISGAAVASLSGVGGGKHLRLRLKLQGRGLDAIFFGVSPQDAALNPGDAVDVAFFPQINEFRGVRSVQLLVVDLRPAQSPIQAEEELLRHYRAGALTPPEAACLLPQRQEFEQLWRFLVRSARGGCLEEPPLKLWRRASRVCASQPAFTRTMVCLDVFDERGLITLRSSTGRLHISLNHVEGKVDLNSSPILRQLRTLLDG